MIEWLVGIYLEAVARIDQFLTRIEINRQKRENEKILSLVRCIFCGKLASRSTMLLNEVWPLRYSNPGLEDLAGWMCKDWPECEIQMVNQAAERARAAK